MKMNKKISSPIGRRIKQAREEAGLIQAELGKKYGCSAVNISQWENGKRNINTGNLKKIADILGKPTAWFLAEDEVPTSSPRRNDDVQVVVQIPIYGQCASAGPGSPIQEYAYKSSAQLAGKNIIGIKVSGECLHPHLQDGDIIFYDADASPRDKDMVVVIIGDALNVKRFRQRGQETWLESNGDTIEINGAQIQGVVLSFERQVR
jgi:repressor LexA